jgi:CheY-like chemotaxis protein
MGEGKALAANAFVVLLVDDNSGDVRLAKEAFRLADEAIHLQVAGDGEEAMAYLRQEAGPVRAPRPALILLDLNLPGMNGFDILAQIKEDRRLKTIPIVILTSSESPEDLTKSYQLGANAYLAKPMGFDAFARVVASIIDFWLRSARLPPSRPD